MTSISLQDRRAYSVEEAAKLLGVSRVTIFRRLAEGRIGSIRLGRRRLIPTHALETLLREGA
jgi:excisionase family DNA binding protein